MNELLSIIVPVYNVEKYIAKCIESIINQSYAPIELILVDDGSTDDSGIICDYYAQKHNNINVIHTPNKGVSNARNTGLENARGNYIAFVDSDDWCDSQMYEILMASIKALHVDVAICGGIVECEDDNSVTPNWINEALRTKFVYSEGFSRESFSVKGVEPFVWNKVYKRSLLDDPLYRFTSGLGVGEDAVFTRTLFPQVKKFVVLPDQLYHYRFDRKDSLSYSNKDTYTLCTHHLHIISSLARNWEAQGLFNVYKDYFLQWSLNFIFWQIESIQSQELAFEYISICDQYDLLNSCGSLPKDEQLHMKKIVSWSNTDKEFRDSFNEKAKKRALIKEKIRRNRLASELFDVYWMLKYRGGKAAISRFKICLKLYKNIFIRDGLIFYIKAILRVCRIPFAYNPYKTITEVKNRHLGESCFVVATGPSLTTNDIGMIKDIPSFAVNGTISLLDTIDWHPMYYVLFDGRAYEKIKKEQGRFRVDSFSQREAFINDLLKSDISKESMGDKLVFIPYCNGGNADDRDILKLRYTKNLLWGYYDLATVTIAAIHIAQYMGFKKIFLLGVDCDYSMPKQYFTNTQNDNIKNVKEAQIAQKRMIRAYTYIKEKMDKNGVEVYNATRGGALEVFPRVDFDIAVQQVKEDMLRLQEKE